MTTLGIRLPFDEKMKFMQLAEKNDLSASQLIRAFIRNYIQEQEQKQNERNA